MMNCLIVFVPALLASVSVPAAPVPHLRFVFEEVVSLAPDEPAGEGPHGPRNRILLLGGTVSGPRLTGTVLPGASDWQVVRADGCSEVLADYFVRANDGTLIHVRNAGLACAPTAGRPAYLHANPVLEAPKGPHDWLNRSVFTSTIAVEPNGGRRVRIRFYEVD